METVVDVAVYLPPRKHIFDGAQTKARQCYYDESVLPFKNLGNCVITISVFAHNEISVSTFSIVRAILFIYPR